MSRSSDIFKLARRLRQSLNSDSADDFGNALSDNDLDYDEIAGAIFVFLRDSNPDDFQGTSSWFMIAWAEMAGYFDKKSRTTADIMDVLQFWCSDPRWQGDHNALQRTFASECLRMYKQP